MYKLPLEIKLSKEIQDLLLETSSNLSELNGLNLIIPNSNIILNALTLTEAKESSAIENIFTTYDELFKQMADVGEQNLSAKEVIKYRSSLLYGVNEIKSKNQLNLSLVNGVHDLLDPHHKGIREYDEVNKTVIKNLKTNEVVYIPPQPKKEILKYLDNLFHYIWKKNDMHPLIKMAIIHLQFEMIHPYRDGNGRTGRILNILYLLQTKIISVPALYISKYIIDNKREYYELLNKSGQDVNCVPRFIKYMLRAINITAKRTKNYILKINELISSAKREVKTVLPKIYSHELVEALFYDLYTRAKFIMAKVNVSRKTADRYLKLLKDKGFLDSQKIGKEVIYVNKKLNVLLDLIDD